MTQEDKLLLLKDLSARLPYNVRISVDNDNLFIPRLKYIDGLTCHFYECGWTKYIDEIKPYLRSLSSMTDEEKGQTRDFWIDADTRTFAIRLIDFYNKNHFDYRGLIPKGLALEVPKEMYT